MDYCDTDNKIEAYRDEIIETTNRLVRSVSVIGEPREGMPFGKPIYDTLELMLSICSDMGFRVKNCDGYCGWAEIGWGNEMVGILCHLDVVPAGEGWTRQPFDAVVEDEKIYGRGSIDDKGPTVAALYAVKAYSELVPELNKRIRLIFGCNEENDWICMDHYKKNEELPTCGFAPDASFPVIYAEKGISFPILTGSFDVSGSTRIISLDGGSSANMVAGSCSAKVVSPDADKIFNRFASISGEELGGASLECDTSEDEINLRTKGRIAHGSTPWEGINAISAMMYALGTIDGLDPDQKRFVDYFNESIGFETDGTNMCGGVIEDKASGRLVNNVGTCHMDEKGGKICLNERYPVTVEGAVLHEMIRSQAEKYGIDLSLRLDSPPGYVPKDDPMIIKLMEVYRHYVNDPTEPMLIGGGTYARSMENCVAYGPLLPWRQELAHCPDEFVYIEDLILAAKIYAAAVAQLCAD